MMMLTLFFLFGFSSMCMSSSIIIFLFFFFYFFLKSGYLFSFFCLCLDKVSFLLVFLTFWSFLVIILVLFKYFKYRDWKNLMMFFFVLLFVFLLLSFSFVNFFGFYVFFELSLIPLLFIIIFWGYQVERIQASYYLFLYTIFGSLPLLMVLIYFSHMHSLVWFFFPFSFFSFFSFMSLSIFVMAFFIKLPLYGFHLWLPKAHVEAPVGGSMILAAVLLKLGGYGVVRILFNYSKLNFVFFFFSVVSLWGALLSSLICIRLSDMKALVAYSSISHMGVMISGMFSNSIVGIKGSFVMLMGHGFCSSMLFYLVNFHYERVFSRQMFVNRGFLSVSFFISVMWFLFLIINFAAPPFLNLFGELLVFLTFSNNIFLLVLLGCIGFLVAYYCILVFSIICHGFNFKSKSLLNVVDMTFFLAILHFFPLMFFIFKLEFFF